MKFYIGDWVRTPCGGKAVVTATSEEWLGKHCKIKSVAVQSFKNGGITIYRSSEMEGLTVIREARNERGKGASNYDVE